MLMAAWLHDVLEDTDIPEEKIGLLFGQKTLNLVIELTNVYTKEAYPLFNRESRKRLEHYRLGLVSDSAKLIKLADRLDNCYSYPLGEIPKFYKLETIDLLGKIGEVCPKTSNTILDLMEV